MRKQPSVCEKKRVAGDASESRTVSTRGRHEDDDASEAGQEYREARWKTFEQEGRNLSMSVRRTRGEARRRAR